MNDSFYGNEAQNNAPSPENDTVSLRWDAYSTSDEKRAKKTFSRYFLGLTLFSLSATAFVYALMLLVVIPLGLRDTPFVQSKLFTWLVEQVLSMYVIGFGVYYLIVRKMRISPRAKSSLTFKEFLIFYAVAHACMLVGAFVGNLINGAIEDLCGWEITNDVSDLIIGTDFWLSFPIVAIVGPFIEELLFRKFMIDRLSRYGDKIAILVSGIAFGLFHGNLYQFFYAALLGIVLGYLYTRTGNMLYTFAVHALINGLSTLTVFLIPVQNKYLEIYEQVESGALSEFPAEFSRYSAILTGYEIYEYGLAVIGIVLFFKLRKKIFVSDRCEVLIPKYRTASVVCLNFGGIFFILFSLFSILFSIFSPLLTR